MASMWNKVRSAEVSGGGIYFKARTDKIGDSCKYRVKLTGLKSVAGQRGGPFAVIETEILESVVEERAAGSKCSQVIDMGSVMGPINVKQFLAAMFGINGSKFSAEGLSGEIERVGSDLFGRSLDIEKICEAVFANDDQSPFYDLEMTLTALNVETREAKKLFTKIVWDRSED